MKKIKVSQFLLLSILFVFTAICILPVVLVAIISLSDAASIATKGYSFFPEKWSLDGWLYVYKMRSKVFQAYKITILQGVISLVSQLLFESMLAFVLSRPKYLLRGVFSRMMLFSTLFSGGMLSSYIINTSIYHLKDNFLILCIPGIGMMHVIMMRTYIQQTISESVVESAKMDGASDFRVYWRIILPLMKPSMAAIGFMGAVREWNEWQKADIYITTASKKPLQNLLISIEDTITALDNTELTGTALEQMEQSIPADSTRMALLFAVLGPIMVAYPFFQKYFVKGLTVGSVKG